MMFTVLWDNDGVLVDSEGLYFQATQTVLRTVGIELTPKQFIEISVKRGESTIGLAAEQGISHEEIARLGAECDRIYTDLLRTQPCVVDAAGPVLESLYGRVRMSVVTSTRRRHFEAAHAKSGFARYFDFVITHEDYRHTKPHPEPYLTAIERYGLEPAKCIVIEDSERGLASATAAGLECLIVLSEWTKDGDFRQACKVLDNVSAVVDEVLKRSARDHIAHA